MMATLTVLCRDCSSTLRAKATPARCPKCGSPRLIAHKELTDLAIAHVDCDAFYASIEKRDHPELADKPLIIGGGKRGVVSTCCYIARQYGVRSAMPMFTANRLCPHAVVMPPNMAKYVAVSREIRAMMDALTPMVEPLSIDEAFLDLSGTEALHKASPAEVLTRFAKRIETELKVTISVGLSHNKFLAKVALDLDKPRGFAVIGRAETMTFLAGQPLSLIFGVGKVFEETLRKDGLLTIGQVQNRSIEDLIRRYGDTGARLWHLARGDDSRKITPDDPMKTISAENTFNKDLRDFDALSVELLALSERLSERLKSKGIVGDTVTLKLKSAGFKLRTRARHLTIPTQLASVLYDVGQQLLAREIDGTAFRLIGIGLSGLSDAGTEDPVDLIEPNVARKAAAERAMDRVRTRFGREAVIRGKLYGRRKQADAAPTANDEEQT